MKRVVIVHGWGGRPEEGWFPWLKGELEAKGFSVSVPALPNTDEPHIATWVPALAEAVGTPDEDTYLVGHSIGCQTIIRYLETLPEGQRVGGAIFVAGFLLPLINLGEDEDEDIAREWAETPIDFHKVRSHLPRSFALFSDNDQWVSPANVQEFEQKLGSETLVEHNRGHFNEESRTKELPIVLTKLLQIAN